ncbi:MAG: EAL domain-containing response regulator [Kangiellaceae bacterium]|nr:EAL domain-containing response regulator [Kangiellaceae bacterium]
MSVLAKTNILIVDDSRAICEAIRAILFHLGVNSIEMEHDGYSAVERVKYGATQFDLIILDLHMPKMDGLQCLRNLERCQYKGAIVLMSGLEPRVLSSAIRASRQYNLNLLGSISKPFLEINFRIMLQRLEGTQQFSLKSTEGFLKRREVEDAIELNQLTPYYQPIVNIQSGEIDYFEVLLRADVPGKGIVPPNLIIPVAEKFDLIQQLTFGTFKKALNELGPLFESNNGYKMSINLSPKMLENRALPDTVEAIVEEAQISPESIVFEITETGIINRTGLTYEVLDRLIIKGFKLAMDDFGTGFSNVEQLTSMPFTHLKIDRCFVHGISHDEISQVIVKSLMEIAKVLKMEVIAEGVESYQDFETVKEIGCAHVQGYIISKPKPISEINRWISGWHGLMASKVG